MIESAVQFGPQASLIGVLTQPTTARDPSLAFLMFNAGVLPRIGPHRLNVKLARALAQADQTSFRFDLAGQGDSRGGGREFRDQAVSDLRCAMDHLEQTRGITRFALIGFCSGAVNAYDAAQADARVCGLLMFDGHWYRSRWSIPVRRWKRFREMPWSSLPGALGKRLRQAMQPKDAAAQSDKGVFDGEVPTGSPTRADFVRSIDTLVRRGVAVFFMYSGSVIDYYSYADQFRHVFGREWFFDKVRCDFRPDIDHTFLSLETQRRMIDCVVGWGETLAVVKLPFP